MDTNLENPQDTPKTTESRAGGAMAARSRRGRVRARAVTVRPSTVKAQLVFGLLFYFPISTD